MEVRTLLENMRALRREYVLLEVLQIEIPQCCGSAPGIQEVLDLFDKHKKRVAAEERAAQEIIDNVEDKTLRQLLQLRFSDGKTMPEWRIIADQIMYSENHTRGKLFRQALAAAERAAKKYA